jgi:hypothetical protein
VLDRLLEDARAPVSPRAAIEGVGTLLVRLAKSRLELEPTARDVSGW